MSFANRIPIVVTSDAAVAVASRPIRTDGTAQEFQVVSAPAALVELEGSLDGTTWVDLNYENLPGAGFIMTVMNTLGAGYYKVHERPEFVRMLVAIDAGGPQDYYAVLIARKRN
jgi:hypothetical protein